MRERRGLLGEISWFQVLAGALAAMTSAWIASALGIAGTIIGAAVGSLVVTISTAMYLRTLDRGRVLVVRTESGTTIEQRVDDSRPPLTQSAEVSSDVADARVEPEARRLHWRTIGVTTVVVLLLSFIGMGAYELATGDAFGSDPDNPRIGNPFGDRSDTSTDEPADDATEPTPSPSTASPTPSPTPTATEPTPTPTATTEPTPTPSPTVTEPAE